MIYMERTITINKGTAAIDETIFLYKGDKNVKIQFTIKNSPFKYRNEIIATYGQLVIQRESAPSIFSEISKLSNGKIVFIITGEMIDELVELGGYTFQIRLFNEDLTSRATLPVVDAGIVIKLPICDGEEAYVNVAWVNESKAVVTVNDVIDRIIFDEEGRYLKTSWYGGDLITDGKLNKIEQAIEHISIDSISHATISYADDIYNQLYDEIKRIDMVHRSNYQELVDKIADLEDETDQRFREIEESLGEI